jgi:hypothetical protein
MNNKNTNPQSILLHIAEEDIPANKIKVWSGLHKTLLQSKKPTQQGVSTMFKTIKRKKQLAVYAGFVLILTIALLILTPQGQAFAQQLLGFFIPVSEHASFPVPKAALTAQANTDQVSPTEVPTSTPVSANACPQTNAEEKYACDMAFIKKELGDWIKVLPYNYGGLEYRGYKIYPIPMTASIILTIEYGPEPYGAIAILQGHGDFPKTLSGDGSDDHWSEVPANAIQAVTVNGQPGEYVYGAFVQMIENGKPNDKYTWNSEIAMARLRWKEDNTWFQVMRPGVPEEFRQVIGTKDGILKLAESLIKVSEITSRN